MPKFDDLPWGNIIESDEKSKFDKLPDKSVLGYVLNESHYSAVAEAALKALKKIDPSRANLENAAKIAEKMKTFAKNILNK